MKKEGEEPNHVKLWHRFVCGNGPKVDFLTPPGGVGDMTASCVSHPFDILKVRTQLQGELQTAAKKPSLFSIAKNIIQLEGFGGLYRGLSASLLRQFLFSSNRHGGYAVILYYYLQHKNGGTTTNQVTTTDKYEVLLIERLMAGILSGSVSALLANPADVILVRMQADGSKQKDLQRNYRHVFDGINRVVKEEGLLQLWRGCGPTVLRATLITSTQLSAYDTFKKLLTTSGLPFFENQHVVHISSSILTAFVASLVSAPVDLIKTRLMNNQMYRGSYHCFRETLRNEGHFGLFKGLVPAFVRLAPHNIVLWLTIERMQRFLAS